MLEALAVINRLFYFRIFDHLMLHSPKNGGSQNIVPLIRENSLYEMDVSTQSYVVRWGRVPTLLSCSESVVDMLKDFRVGPCTCQKHESVPMSHKLPSIFMPDDPVVKVYKVSEWSGCHSTGLMPMIQLRAPSTHARNTFSHLIR
jgi:hypothetical protein